MATVMILKDGKREIVTKDRHFTELIRAYMGEDAARFYEDRIGDVLSAVRTAQLVAREGDPNRYNLDAIYDILDEVTDE